MRTSYALMRKKRKGQMNRTAVRQDGGSYHVNLDNCRAIVNGGMDNVELLLCPAGRNASHQPIDFSRQIHTFEVACAGVRIPAKS